MEGSMKGVKIILLLVATIFLSNLSFSFYLNLTPSQRKDLAKDWLEVAKSYEKNNKTKKAIVSYKHVYNLYPFSDEAKESQKILKEKYNVSIKTFSEESFEKYNVDLAKKYELKNYNYSVNAYLMAYDVSKKPDYLYQIALLYYKNGNTTKAKEFASKAIEAGFDKSKVKEELIK